MTDLDVIIIGGGAAGLSAALVLARARRSVLVVDAGEPRNAPAAHMHGFLSRDGTPPADLLAAGRAEVGRYGGEVLAGTATAVADEGPRGLQVALEGGRTLRARRLLVATGLRDELPDVPGLWERWGRDVLHCPYCHGFEVRDRPLAVLGWTPTAVEYALIVRQWTQDLVHLAAPGTLGPGERERLEARGIAIAEGETRGLLVRDDRLRGVELVGGRVVPCDALFVPPRFVPHSGLLLALGCEADADGWVVAGPAGRTSHPRVWVAGNVANPRAQVITAAGEGSAAAIAMNADLVQEDVRIAIGGGEPALAAWSAAR